LSARPSVAQRIRDLYAVAPFGVLCTQGEDGPLGSLMACAYSEDLAQVAFSTRRDTHKHAHLVADPRVALVFDDRPLHHDESGTIAQVSVMTVTGRARPLSPGAERDRWTARLLERHPALRGFADDPEVALFVVAIEAIDYVSRFERTERWTPPANDAG
jgi:general stress protein 26